MGQVDRRWESVDGSRDFWLCGKGVYAYWGLGWSGVGVAGVVGGCAHAFSFFLIFMGRVCLCMWYGIACFVRYGVVCVALGPAYTQNVRLELLVLFPTRRAGSGRHVSSAIYFPPRIRC